MDSSFNTGQSILTARTSANFVVTPMAGGRPARITQHHSEHAESEAEASSGIGFKMMSAHFGALMGLGHWFDIAMEVLHSGMEYAEENGNGRSSQLVQDVNLDPRAQLRPDASFNFKKLDQPKAAIGVSMPIAEEDEKRPKRTWNSGDLFLAKLSERRVSALPVVPVGAKSRLSSMTVSKSKDS